MMIELTPIIASEQVEAARQLIQQATRVVILTHMSPDGDAMGSSLAMRHFLEAQGKQVNVIVPNSFPDFLAWLPKASEHIIYETSSDKANHLMEQAELVICTDFNDPKRIGSLGDKLLTLSCKKMMIDHHLHPASFPDLTISYPATPSTCELVYRLINHLATDNAQLSTDIATCIYTGMMTDTGNFSFNSNYPEMYKIVGELVAAGVNKDEIYNRVFNAYSADRM
jgi:phosphoesterase RecJ-like protein